MLAPPPDLPALLVSAGPSAHPPTPSGERLVDTLVRVAGDERFFWRVYTGCGLDIGYEGRGARAGDAQAEVRTAIKLAVPRAWLYRFLADAGLDPQVALGGKHRDRDADEARVRATYPTYAAFVPVPALTLDEVFVACREEVRRTFQGRGSDGHARRFTRDYVFQGSGDDAHDFRAGLLKVRGTDRDDTRTFCTDRPEPPDGHAPARPPTTGRDIPFAGNGAFSLDGASDLFGPVIAKSAAFLLPLVGLGPTTYWAFSTKFFPGEHAKLLRALGGEAVRTLATVDPAAFKAMQVDLGRKLKWMDALVTGRDASDPHAPEVQALHGVLRDFYDHLYEAA